MNIEQYIKNKKQSETDASKYRVLCTDCLQPDFSCYCQHIKRFDPKIKFVILIHPIEAKRRIATGRMSHLCLENSELIQGQDYSQNKKINQILENPKYQPMVLYPGSKSLNLSSCDRPIKENLFISEKEPVVFVIDGTWATARKTMRQSINLSNLPRICFTPPVSSQFRVRKQPGENCYSTIEAIHYTIELLGAYKGFNVESRDHDNLINVFNKMVENQLSFIRKAYDNPKPTAYRRPRLRIA